MNAIEKNVEVMLELFRAIERRDDPAVLACCHPQVEFHWPPSLRYGAALFLRARRSLKSGGGLASKDRLFVAVLAIEDTPVNDGECADLDTVAKTGKRF